MKIARSWKGFALGLVVLFFLALAFANLIADRCSANLEANEITWEEVVDQQRADAAKRGD